MTQLPVLRENSNLQSSQTYHHTKANIDKISGESSIIFPPKEGHLSADTCPQPS